MLDMTRCPEELRMSIIQRMMPPQSESVSAFSRETGIPEQTLFVWRWDAKEKGIPIPNGKVNSERWSTQDKFNIVDEMAVLSEIELTEYCRNKGLYVEQFLFNYDKLLDQWLLYN